MRSNTNQNKSIGLLDLSARNFITYVYSLSSAGLTISFGFAALIGEIFLKIAGNFGGKMLYLLAIPIILVSVMEFFLDRKLTDSEYLVRQPMSSLLKLMFLRVLTSGFLMMPLYVVCRVIDMKIYLTALVISVVTFVAFAMFVYFSKRDFTFNSNTNTGSFFFRIVGFLVVLLIILSLGTFLVSFVSPKIAHMLNGVHILLSLVLSFIFVIYTNAIVKEMYNDYYYVGGSTLAKLGIGGSILIMSSFIYLFQTIVRLLLYNRRRD
jgi:FtsH-binding integral membrane protein